MALDKDFIGSIYFGHPISFYNTPIEERLVQAIYKKFPVALVENPNQTKHDEGYKRYKEAGMKSMDYFFHEVLPRCKAGIFLPFADGMFGKGVYGEAEWLAERGKPIMQIDIEGNIGKLVLEPSRCLSVEDTRARVYPFDEKRAEVIAKYG